MTTVLHTADTHLGYRQYNSPTRRDDFLSAFEAVLRDAVEADVDAVVHAGDVFHDRRPGLVDLLGTVSALRILEDAGIPFLAIVGNHEDKREAQWLDLFSTLGLAQRLDATGTVVGDVTLYGLDFVPKSRRDDLDYQFEPPETDRAALVAHGQFAPLAPEIRGDTWDVETVIEESNVDFDAVLLGDDHEPDTAEVADTWVTYSGSTERTSASERDDRGYNLVTFGDTVDIRRKGIDTRDFEFVDVELHEGEGADRVRDRVREFDVENAVVIVTVTGDGESFPPAVIEEFATERGALVARVNDRRDIQTESETPDVNFADPDNAVRERIREMGLSTAARDIDETIRSGGPDSKVRSEVRDRIETLLDADPDGFEPAPDDGSVTEPDAENETEPEADPETDSEIVDSVAESAEEPVEMEGEAEADANAETEAGEPSEESAADTDESTEPTEQTKATEPTEVAPADPSDGDGQSSVEDYL